MRVAPGRVPDGSKGAAGRARIGAVAPDDAAPARRSAVLGWPAVLSPPAVAVALVFSAAVGIFFGPYPARRAARLSPIEALRHE